jgi:two-component system, OmpR family, response regulator
MKRTVEANFLPFVVESLKARACILIVDDNRDLTRAAKLGLERTGCYVVHEENDSTRAHQTAQVVHPDLILLDIVMPETDGGEVAAQIESDLALHRIPIVFLTAPATKWEQKSGLRIEGRAFLAKPISVPALIKAVEENLPAHA